MADNMTPEVANYLHTLNLGKTPTPAQTAAFNAAVEAIEAAPPAAPAMPAARVSATGEQVISTPLTDPFNVAELVGPEDDPDHPIHSMVQCEAEGCRNPADGGTLYFSGRRPVSMNARGEIVRGDWVPVVVERYTGAIGPAAARRDAAAAQQIKREITLCREHYRLDAPRVPIKPRKRYTSGPYANPLGAQARATAVENFTGDIPRIFSRRLPDGKIGHFVNGDTRDLPGWRGEMTPAE
jgi:hypothetical protein